MELKFKGHYEGFITGLSPHFYFSMGKVKPLLRTVILNCINGNEIMEKNYVPLIPFKKIQ